MLIEKFLNKKILIYGLGVSGNSCLKYLKKKNDVNVYDDNHSLKNNKNKKYFLDKNKIIKLEFDYIVISPGINHKKCKLKSYLLKNWSKILTLMWPPWPSVHPEPAKRVATKR